MISDADQFWDRIATEYRQARKLRPMTYEEAEAAFDGAPEIPMTSEEIESIVERVVTGEPREREVGQPWLSEHQFDGAEENSLAVYREEGVLDPKIAETEEELRKRMLNEESSEQRTGMDGESAPPGDCQKDGR